MKQTFIHTELFIVASSYRQALTLLFDTFHNEVDAFLATEVRWQSSDLGRGGNILMTSSVSGNGKHIGPFHGWTGQ